MDIVHGLIHTGTDTNSQQQLAGAKQCDLGANHLSVCHIEDGELKAGGGGVTVRVLMPSTCRQQDDTSVPSPALSHDLLDEDVGDGYHLVACEEDVCSPLTAQLMAAGPVGVAAAAAISSTRKRKRLYSFETNPSIRKRQQTRLIRKIRSIIEEYTCRIGQQAVVMFATPGKSSNVYKVFGSKPLDDVVRSLRMPVTQKLEELLSQHAPAQPSHRDPSRHELPPLVIDGIPTPVEKMTQAQLRAFIPLMLKFSTGRGKPSWGRLSARPVWWPVNVPWANVRSDHRSQRQKHKLSWTHALRQIVINCYMYHGRDDLLPAFTEDERQSQQPSAGEEGGGGQGEGGLISAASKPAINSLAQHTQHTALRHSSAVSSRRQLSACEHVSLSPLPRLPAPPTGQFGRDERPGSIALEAPNSLMGRDGGSDTVHYRVMAASCRGGASVSSPTSLPPPASSAVSASHERVRTAQHTAGSREVSVQHTDAGTGGAGGGTSETQQSLIHAQQTVLEDGSLVDADKHDTAQFVQALMHTISGTSGGTVQIVQVDANSSLITLSDGTQAHVQAVRSMDDGSLYTGGEETVNIDLGTVTEATMNSDGHFLLNTSSATDNDFSSSSIVTIPINSPVYQSLVAQSCIHNQIHDEDNVESVQMAECNDRVDGLENGIKSEIGVPMDHI